MSATLSMRDDLQGEQEYFDAAREARERFRHSLQDAPGAAAHARMAYHLRRNAESAAAELGGPDDAVAVGRLDLEGDDEPVYVGRHAVFDEESDALVVSWKAPIAEPFYEATPDDPRGVLRKRTFSCDKNTITSYDDMVFAEIRDRIGDLVEGELAAGRYDDALLSELGRQRTGEMREIVQTIQAAQYELIRQPLDQVLVVQGGPGTGKTVVALHRVSWLLFNRRDVLTPGDVLVVGPNKTFVRYIRQVLPTLGDSDVRQVELGGLGPTVSQGRDEADDVARVKGDLRMASLLNRALRDRVSVPDGPLEIRVGRRVLPLPTVGLEAKLDELREAPYVIGRQGLRAWIRGQVEERYREKPAADAVDLVLERIWPQATAPAFLRELFGSEARLLRAAGDDLTAREVRLLSRRPAARVSDEIWSAADIPLLDHLDQALNGGVGPKYRHIVVDEAQDLSPMQVASVTRRLAAPSLTLLGDLAQSTGSWSRGDWQEVLDDLQLSLGELEMAGQVAELQHGYRVPRQIYEFAATLLPAIAPGLTPPVVVREGSDPVLHQEDIDDVAGRAVRQAMEYSARGLLVGVVSPAQRHGDLARALADRGVQWRDSGQVGLAAGINLLDPETAKGLEFDAAVVAYPEEIVGRLGVRGARLLYVALTRATGALAVVYSTSPLGGVLAAAGGGAEPADMEIERVAAAPVVTPIGTGERVPDLVPRQRAVGVDPSAGVDEDPLSEAFDTSGSPVQGQSVAQAASAPARPVLADPRRRADVPRRSASAHARARAAVRLAEDLAEEVRASLQPALWQQVVDELRDLLTGRVDIEAPTAED